MLKLKSKLITDGDHAAYQKKKQMASMADTAGVDLCVRITHHAVSTLVAAPVLLSLSLSLSLLHTHTFTHSTTLPDTN